jgi:hypothetical protein
MGGAVDKERPEETLLRMFDEAAPWPSIRSAIRAVLRPEEGLVSQPHGEVITDANGDELEHGEPDYPGQFEETK